MSTRQRETGEFCWINMLTPHVDQARSFFGDLLGWGYAEIPGLGYRMQVGGTDIGAIFDLAGPNTPPDTPPLIGVMVKVMSADDVCRRVTAAGGHAMPAFDVGDQLRMAVCHDPAGAEFDLWETKHSGGFEVDAALHGAPSWFETMTSDAERAAPFYQNVFGWTPETAPVPGSRYTVFRRGAHAVAGMMPIGSDLGSTKPHWVTYFTVKDAGAAVDAARSLGAQVSTPIHDAPDVGRFCGLTSPQGVAFRVIEYTH
jgi:predicted enzyme related to lactoylglutathione lyase